MTTVAPAMGIDARLPVVRNFEPSSDLRLFISRFFVTSVDQADDDVAEEILLNEAAMVQVPLRGDWSWLSETGEWQDFAGLACCRFDGHQEKVFYRTGGPTWNEGSLRASLSSRQ